MRTSKALMLLVLAAVVFLAGSCAPSALAPATTQGGSTVAISGSAFLPGALTVKVGTTVTWTNEDTSAHTVTSTSGPLSFDSGQLGKGQTFSFAFSVPGTWNYHCLNHPGMTGMVSVTN